MGFKLTTTQRNLIMRALLLIVGAAPLLNPIGLPTKIDKWTQEFYDNLAALPPGSTVIIEDEFDMGAYSMCAYGAVATFQFLWERGVRTVIYTFQAAGIATMDAIMNEPPMIAAKAKVTYGVDWIYVGFVPGEEAGMATVAKDPWYTKTDRYGTALSSLPLTQGIDHITDFDMIIFLNKSQFYQLALLHQWITPYGVPAQGIYGVGEWSGMQMFYPDLLQGLLQAMDPGAIGLEQLTGYIYKGTSYADAMSFMGIYICGLVVLGNVVLWAGKLTGKKEEVVA